MKTAIVTGSSGLIGSETAKHLLEHGHKVIGIDNDMRSYFFGPDASTQHVCDELSAKYDNFVPQDTDIRDFKSLEQIFKYYGSDIDLVVHTAAQPSHDWAAKEPLTDFGVNATGTLHMLEATRLYAPEAVFIFTSTNKVYGNLPNRLPLVELDQRWEIDASHPYQIGIDEHMSLDQCKHSIFGASKVSADVMVQEYGQYFGMKTGVFRGGCLTGPAHAGAELHGFLAYLMKCIVEQKSYRIFGYKGKQVRDNIHAADLVSAFMQFYNAPRSGEVYNIGGSRHSNCSMLEAIAKGEELSGNKLDYTYLDDHRIGDHIWYISDVRKFQSHYPGWAYQYNIDDILTEIFEACTQA